MRWLYHVTSDHAVHEGDEGFVHCSFRDAVNETASLYFTSILQRDLRVIRIDPRRVDVRIAATPRGPMPHVFGEIKPDAIVDTTSLVALDSLGPDAVTGTRFAVVGFAGMTLLDLVGVLDPLMRIASMAVDRDASIEVVSATDEPWSADGATFGAARVRPPLDAFDVLVVAGGPETRALEHDARVIDWLKAFPENRLAASVCTGALLLGAAGRLAGKRATTHHASIERLADFGATAVNERVVRDGQLVTAGGVTSAIDLGLWLVAHHYGEEARARIAARMEYPRSPL